MSTLRTLDRAGRRRSPATMPGYQAGRPPANKGMRYPADPPRVEEIVAVMREAGESVYGRRLRGLIVVLWRAGLRIHEALALAESDLEERRGAMVVRHGKGDKRREVGMDDWGWEQLRPWLSHRATMPVGALFCVMDGPSAGRPWTASAVRCQLRRLAARAGVRRRFAPQPAASRSCHRDGARGRAGQHHPAPARPHRPRRHIDLPAGHRQRRDRQRGARPQSADDAGERGTAILTRARRLASAAASPDADRAKR